MQNKLGPLNQLPQDIKDFKVNIKEFTLEDVEKGIIAYLSSKNLDIDIKPDIVIETAKPTYFACSISTGSLKLNTGIGGFKMFLKDMPDLLLLKISFNGKILDNKEKQELYDKYR